MNLEDRIEVQKGAVYAWFEGVSAGDLDAAYSGFEDDCTWLGIGPDFKRLEYRGKAAIIDYLSAWIGKVWSGLRYHPLNVVGDGEAVLAEWEDEAIGRSGQTYTNRGVLVCEFDGGLKVVRARSYFDYEPLLGDPIAAFETEGAGEAGA